MGEVESINPEANNAQLSADEGKIALSAIANTAFPGSASEVISRIKLKLQLQIQSFNSVAAPEGGPDKGSPKKQNA